MASRQCLPGHAGAREDAQGVHPPFAAWSPERYGAGGACPSRRLGQLCWRPGVVRLGRRPSARHPGWTGLCGRRFRWWGQHLRGSRTRRPAGVEGTHPRAVAHPTICRRWRHSQTAAQAAVEAGQALDPQERAVLISAAWLDDIDYHHPAPRPGSTPWTVPPWSRPTDGRCGWRRENCVNRTWSRPPHASISPCSAQDSTPTRPFPCRNEATCPTTPRPPWPRRAPQRPADLEAALHAAVSLSEPTATKQWVLVAHEANRLPLATSPAGSCPRADGHVLTANGGGGLDQ